MSSAFFGLGLGLAGSSFFAWGSVALGVAGITPAVTNSELRKRKGITVDTALELWAWHFHIMKLLAPGSTFVAIVGYCFASLTFESARRYLLFAALSAFGSMAFTAFMVPANTLLLGFERKIISSRSAQSDKQVQILTETEQKEALRVLRKWTRLHYVRITLGLVGWCFGLGAAGLARL